MVYEYSYLPLDRWLSSLTEGPILYLFALPFALVAAAFIGMLIAVVRLGPTKAFEATYQLLTGSFFDLVGLSFRRIYAIAMVVVKDAWRRRIWAVLVIFALLLTFFSLYMSPNTNDPGELYTRNTLNIATRYLLLIVMLIISVFSIPQDFKNRTIFTIVTKPVRTAELVLGRLFGFMAIGSALLAVMGLVSYIFLYRSLQHTHEIDADTLKHLAAVPTETVSGRTSLDHRHFHNLNLNPTNDQNWTDFEFGHRHEVVKQPDGSFRLLEPDELLQARVQHLGELRFIDDEGNPKERGISVGKEWTYRSFIGGATSAAAIWTFTDVTPQRYPDGLRIEATLRIFRTSHNEKSIPVPLRGSLTIRNPVTKATSVPIRINAKDNVIDTFEIPLDLEVQQRDNSIRPGKLFEDFVSDDHRLEIQVQCNETMQFFGMAQRDLYLKAPDVPYWWNFVKALLCIWLQMLILVSCGVFFSTFVSAPVALLCTVGFLILGMSSQFVDDMCKSTLFMEENARGKTYYGGGPLESSYRLFTSMNVTSPLEPSTTTTIIKMLDRPLLWAIYLIHQLIPQFDRFNTVSILEQGFNIPGELVVQLIFQACFFALTTFLLGLAMLRMREVAR